MHVGAQVDSAAEKRTENVCGSDIEVRKASECGVGLARNMIYRLVLPLECQALKSRIRSFCWDGSLRGVGGMVCWCRIDTPWMNGLPRDAKRFRSGLCVWNNLRRQSVHKCQQSH